MKKQLLLLTVLFIGTTVFAQKSELKTAGKAIKSGDFATAITAVNQAESLIANADQKTKAKFYYLKSKALYQNGGATINVEKVGAAFNELLAFENDTKKYKYTKEIGALINKLIESTAKQASAFYTAALETKNNADYSKAAKKFHEVYMLSPNDTSYLDNAALVYYVGKDYKTSVKLYKKLLSLNYTGITTIYVATNKANGEEVVYNDKKAMDLQVKLGIAENPRTEQKDSRREVIFKNLANNHVALENNAKALEVLTNGRKEFPNSYSLLIDEANIYYKLGENAKFQSRLEEAIRLNPTEPTLYYNVGVMKMDQKKIDEAIKNFEKAIELKPDYGDAYNNIGAAIIEKANPIVEEMNKSLSDFDKYDKLQAKQFEIYKQAIPYYEKAYEFNKTSISVVQTLMSLYENLEMTEKHQAMRAVYDALKQ